MVDTRFGVPKFALNVQLAVKQIEVERVLVLVD